MLMTALELSAGPEAIAGQQWPQEDEIMAMSMGGANRTRAEMNVTPMIDVLLVLLVIFMVCSPLKPRGLPALVPQSAPEDNATKAPAPPSTELVLTVRGDGALDLNQEAVERSLLRARLMEILKIRGDGLIFVRGEGDLVFGRVAQVMDIARGAGMSRVALMTTPVR
jgi:biopolymer transport protein ExbD